MADLILSPTFNCKPYYVPPYHWVAFYGSELSLVGYDLSPRYTVNIQSVSLSNCFPSAGHFWVNLLEAYVLSLGSSFLLCQYQLWSTPSVTSIRTDFGGMKSTWRRGNACSYDPWREDNSKNNSLYRNTMENPTEFYLNDEFILYRSWPRQLVYREKWNRIFSGKKKVIRWFLEYLTKYIISVDK